jgi:hypothetical protein
LFGTAEADALYHLAGNKGQARQGGKKLLGRLPRGHRKKREPVCGLPNFGHLLQRACMRSLNVRLGAMALQVMP